MFQTSKSRQNITKEMTDRVKYEKYEKVKQFLHRLIENEGCSLFNILSKDTTNAKNII